MYGLSLLVLRCASIEASKAFYERFGMHFQLHCHGNGPQHYAAESENGVFELYPAGESPSDQTALGFAVADLDASHAAFASAGFEPAPIKDNPWGRSFVVRDPDRRRVEISAK
jgi:catechol 2,3-dioxygenase-like lactoylglutathione lyase family enzyme